MFRLMDVCDRVSRPIIVAQLVRGGRFTASRSRAFGNPNSRTISALEQRVVRAGARPG